MLEGSWEFAQPVHICFVDLQKAFDHVPEDTMELLSFMCFRPFSVTPSSGTLDVFESTQVTVTFNPMTVGDHSQDLLLHYHTGERKPPKLRIMLNN